MTIIKCSKCGSSCPDSAKFCNECGEEIKKENNQLTKEMITKKIKKSKIINKKNMIIVIGIFIFLGTLYFVSEIMPVMEIKNAYANKDYKKIIEIDRNSNKDFGNVIEGYISDAKNEVVGDDNLKKASEFIAKKEYIKAFEILDSYNVHYSKIAQVKALKDNVTPIIAEDYLKSAKMFYKQKNYFEANRTINESLKYGEIAEALKLKPIYSKAYDEYYKRMKVESEKKKKIEEANRKKEELASARKAMKEFQGNGNVAIAVSDVKLKQSTDSHVANGNGIFVYIAVHALNQGSDMVHINPNYFTLSDSKGNTVSHDTDTYSLTNYLDAVDVGAGNQTSGWLIFYINKDSQYKLYYHGFNDDITKELYID